jgi:hypothetical protein
LIFIENMAEKKKQHFVPKLSLRLFSYYNDQKRIGVFNVNSKIFIIDSPISSQAQENYFYGEDAIIENALSRIEGEAGRILKIIVNTQVLPKNNTEDYSNLFLFILMQAFRTKNSANQTDASLDKFFQEIIKRDESFAEYRDKGMHIAMKNSAAFTLAMLYKDIYAISDLSVKLILNETNQKFISSDHPVILYNQYLESRNQFGGHIGLYSKGLQIIYPISPTISLFLYDSWAYKVGDKKKSVIEISNIDDINSLNYLQVLNCSKVVFFNQDITQFYLEALTKKTGELRDNDLFTLDEIKSTKTSIGDRSATFIGHPTQRKIKLNLSFVTETKKAKHYELDNFVVQVRNERMRYRID